MLCISLHAYRWYLLVGGSKYTFCLEDLQINHAVLERKHLRVVHVKLCKQRQQDQQL
jgi:hypothetical protein